jgi:hypothetical protein
VHAHRLTSQRLSGPPAGSVEEVVHHLLAVQAQELRGARLSVRARSTGLRSADVDAALADRTVVVGWLNRGTLHVVRSADYWWLHALTAPTMRATSVRRLEQEGVSPEQAEVGVAAVVTELAGGPRDRNELREVLRSAGVPVAGQALVHVLSLAAQRGHVVRGPMAGDLQAFVLAEQWLGPPPPVDRDASLAELARRYLRGHAPAGARDLARWIGLPLGDARKGLAQIDDEVVRAPDGLLCLADTAPAEPLPPPRLLGPFEPVLLGWTSRDDVVGRHRSLVTVNGIFRAFAMVGGRAVGTWSYAAGRVTTTYLEHVPPAVTAALEDDARGVEAFLG